MSPDSQHNDESDHSQPDNVGSPGDVELLSDMDSKLPHPLLAELQPVIDDMCTVIASWDILLGDSLYTTGIKGEVEQLSVKIALFKSSLEVPAADPEVTVNVNSEWSSLVSEFEDLKGTMSGFVMPKKKLRRNATGDVSEDEQTLHV